MSLFKKKNNSSKKIEISYDISSGIPFRWEYEIEDNTIVELIKKETKGEKTKEPICGGKLTIKYIFKGIKNGKTKIIFKLVNFSDNHIEREEKYDVSVDEKLNIFLLKTN